MLICRLVLGIRSPISIPAGLEAMPLPPFLLYTAVGSYAAVERYVGPLAYVVLGAVALAAVVGIVRRKRHA